ncbi:hypothetical protein NDU88_010135 [Pleurodeles waltl]|uniref:Cation efflux protein cytoplasmic domain-containing protein n=1 Tax=Pleurodeles waltl TaxID=8319 RepID=A0AAV7RYC2_PLEWA|nr:hypothetical protein NDU88_010135 [Pleurodeles waltl]
MRPASGDLKNCADPKLNGNIAHEDNSEELDDAGSQLNMRGVFLHVFGDTLGSVILIVNATVFYFVWKECPDDVPCINPCVDSHFKYHVHPYVNHTVTSLSSNGWNSTTCHETGPCWLLYLDPSLCLMRVCILLYTAFPVLKESALILLQTVPKQIDIYSLSQKLAGIEGVEDVHELHVWQLAGSRIIATAHIKCIDPCMYMGVAKHIKDVFHNEGIHATTVQPEFPAMGSELEISLCELPCSAQCMRKQCCVEKKVRVIDPPALSDSETNGESSKSYEEEQITENLEPQVITNNEDKRIEL